MKTNLFIFMVLFIISLFLTGCSQDNSSDSGSGGGGTKTQTATISGTITIPAVQNGKTGSFLLSIDQKGDTVTDNFSTSLTCGGTTTISYTISNVPYGTYYNLTTIRVVSSSGQPETGDYFTIAIVGPGTPTFTVNAPSMTYDFSLVAVFP